MMSKIHEAAKRGDTEEVRRLLDGGLFRRGADVNARNQDDVTPLHFAAQRGHAETADLLREHGGVE